MKRFVVMLLGFILMSNALHAQRIKDMTAVAGVRSNQLVGYGLVVGLNGTGDQTSQTPFTVQTFKNMLTRFGVKLPPGVTPQLKNVAAVTVHAELPAFAKPGQRLDVTVSSLGNAKSLRGGTLLMMPLKGVNNQIYAMAQGSLVVSGLGAQGDDGSSITVNIPSIGRIPNGAIIEKSSPNGFSMSEKVVLNLHKGDFTTAQRVVEKINTTFGSKISEALDGTSISVRAPSGQGQRIAFMAVLENLEVKAAPAVARVIINSKTGTIVIGEHVRVSPVAVTHGSLTVTISENYEASQPNALSDGGETAILAQSDVEISEEKKRMFLLSKGISLREIVSSINEVGAAPGDLMAILEALKEAGALHAELVVI
ncbi:MAG: flagellar basal body P-ring protein FlgI [Pseudomonadales bacterium]|nr:flagellar basal body P-ring protein FlgI [Pseudomonadales bacterium]